MPETTIGPVTPEHEHWREQWQKYSREVNNEKDGW